MPSTPSAVETGATAGSIVRMPVPSESAHSRHPSECSDPVALGERRVPRHLDAADGAARHRLAERRTEATYERTSLMRGRMYGSTEMYALRTSTSPVGRLGDPISAISKSLAIRDALRASDEPDLATEALPRRR